MMAVNAADGPNAMLALHPMRWWDIEAVAELERTLFPTDSWSIEQFWEELAQPTRWYVVAKDDNGGVAGYAGLFLLAPEADLQTIGVAHSAQGRGVGQLLLNALIEHARQQGCRRLLLEVRAGNLPALNLYRKAGFTQLSRRSRYYPDGGDAIVMTLQLSADLEPVGAPPAGEDALQ